MDFFVTVSSGPTVEYPDNETSWCEYRPEKPIKMDGQYEVALVQSVFEDVHNDCIAHINIFSPNPNMDMFTLKIFANDGDSAETIIRNANMKLSDWIPSGPKIVLNSDTLEFYLDVLQGWAYFVMDVDKNHIQEAYQKANRTFYKFKTHKFHHLRHFYVTSSLIDDQVTGNNSYPLLSNVYIKNLNSNVVQGDIKVPRYVKVRENTLDFFNLEYSTDLQTPTSLKGKIHSTLHFRKINGF